MKEVSFGIRSTLLDATYIVNIVVFSSICTSLVSDGAWHGLELDSTALFLHGQLLLEFFRWRSDCTFNGCHVGEVPDRCGFFE